MALVLFVRLLQTDYKRETFVNQVRVRLLTLSTGTRATTFSAAANVLIGGNHLVTQ